MPGRTLDQIITDVLGLKEMTIQRLIWQIEDLKATIEELKQKDSHGSDTIHSGTDRITETTAGDHD